MTSPAVRAALAELGVEPGDLAPAVLEVVAAHLDGGEVGMNDRLRHEVSAIPDRRRALAARVFAQPATPTEDSPAAPLDLGQGARSVTPEPPDANDWLRGSREHSRRERADRIAEARQDRHQH